MKSKESAYSYVHEYGPIGLLLIAVAIVIGSAFLIPETQIDRYANLTVAVTTLIYIYITYRLLLSTVVSRPLPWLTLEYILANKVEGPPLMQYAEFIQESERLKSIREELATNSTASKELIFIRVQNVGTGVAIDINCDVQYSKRSLGDEAAQTKQISVRDLKPNETSLILLEAFDNPTPNDYLQVNQCRINFTDVGKKHAKEFPFVRDYSANPIVAPRTATGIVEFRTLR